MKRGFQVQWCIHTYCYHEEFWQFEFLLCSWQQSLLSPATESEIWISTQAASQSCASSVIKKKLSTDLLSTFPVSSIFLTFLSDFSSIQVYAFDSDIQFCYTLLPRNPMALSGIVKVEKKISNHCQFLVNYLIYK